MRQRHVQVICLGLLALAIPQPASAQDDTEEVLAIVQRFFDTMTAKDTAGARQVLVLDATYFSVREDTGGTRVRRSTNRAYVEGLSTQTDEWYERMWDPQVMIHGAIAVVWTPYDFRRNGEFSHCGVDAFTLIKTDDGWKIAGVVYTVETECEERD